MCSKYFSLEVSSTSALHEVMFKTPKIKPKKELKSAKHKNYFAKTAKKSDFFHINLLFPIYYEFVWRDPKLK